MKTLFFAVSAALFLSVTAQAASLKSTSLKCHGDVYTADKSKLPIKDPNQLPTERGPKALFKADLDSKCSEMGCLVSFENEKIRFNLHVGQGTQEVYLEDKISGQSQLTSLAGNQGRSSQVAATLLNLKGGLLGDSEAYGLAIGCEE